MSGKTTAKVKSKKFPWSAINREGNPVKGVALSEDDCIIQATFLNVDLDTSKSLFTIGRKKKKGHITQIFNEALRLPVKERMLKIAQIFLERGWFRCKECENRSLEDEYENFHYTIAFEINKPTGIDFVRPFIILQSGYIEICTEEGNHTFYYMCNDNQKSLTFEIFEKILTYDTVPNPSFFKTND